MSPGTRDAPRVLASPLVAALPVDKRFADPASRAGAGRQPAHRGPHVIRMEPLRLPAGGPACSEPVRGKRFVSVAQEAVHARMHPSRGLERCTAALHAEWMRAEYHRYGRGGARVGYRPNWPTQRVEKVRIETRTVCPEPADPVGASVSGRDLGYSPAGSAPCVADCAAAARRRDSSSATSRRASSSSRLASAASRRLRARPISIAAMMPLS